MTPGIAPSGYSPKDICNISRDKKTSVGVPADQWFDPRHFAPQQGGWGGRLLRSAGILDVACCLGEPLVS